jgi:hypothetical protein
MNTIGRVFARAISVLCIAISLLGCEGASVKAPDVTHIDVKLNTRRFDRELYAIDTNAMALGLTQLHTNYPDFLDFFLDTVMGFGIRGRYSDTAAGVRIGLREYITYSDYRNLQATIANTFPDTKADDAGIAQGFRYMKHYFSSAKVPRIFYINQVLQGAPAFCVDTSLCCISLDMFLGIEYPPYRSIGINAYQAPKLERNYIPVALFSALYQSAFPFRTTDRSLLDLMLQRGREQYYLHCLLPTTPDSVLFGFTANQVQWCEKNEALIYNYLISQNLLYNRSERAIMPYVSDGPFARGLGAATDEGKPTPGNVGSWVGYKMVKEYMSKHPKLSLSQLLTQQTEPANFLQDANYKPRQ